MNYKPNPIKTSGVKLSNELHKLIETLAENNHDHWALQRIKESWTYGPERNDIKKTHPDLVPYSKLTESEKEYDRKTTIEVLKAITAIGYTIERRSQKTSSVSGISYLIRDSINKLKNDKNIHFNDLINIWENMSPNSWTGSSDIYELLGHCFLGQSEPLMAFDVISRALKFWPKNKRLKQLLGLALAESGDTEKAHEILSNLYEGGARDGETLGILGRTCKDFWYKTGSFSQLSDAHKYYLKGYRFAKRKKMKGWMDGAFYNGINAASTALLMGNYRKAISTGKEVKDICLKKLKKEEDYWVLATLGETSLILNEYKDAEKWFTRAGKHGKGNFRELSSTRRQIRTLLSHLKENIHLFDHCFNIPNVVVFAGNMIDQPGRPSPRFPKFIEEEVRKEIKNRLNKLNAGFGFSSAACGSDIIFLEEMLKRKAEVNIILPFPMEGFQKASVDIIPGANWGKRFQDVIKKASRVYVASEQRTTGNEVTYQYSNILQDGLSILRAKLLNTEVKPLVVWNKRPGDGAGGTSTMVKHWRSFGLDPEVVDLNNLYKKTTKAKITSKKTYGKPVAQKEIFWNTNSPDLPQKIVGIIFADVVGFSKLKDEELSNYIEHFLGEVDDILSLIPKKPLTKNTWGDAFYFTFDSLKDAGNLALELCERIAKVNWRKKGLPEGINLRIALHTGPAFQCKDPVLKRTNFIGSHISKGARIEPITPPGQVYASQEFAALTAAQRVKDFKCDYVGQIPLPKGFGTFPLYNVQRASN